MTTAATLTATPAARLDVDVLVVPVASGPSGPVLLDDADLPGALRRLAVSPALGVTGEADEVRRIPTGGVAKAPVLAVVGVGEVDPGDVEPEHLRRAAGAACCSSVTSRTASA